MRNTVFIRQGRILLEEEGVPDSGLSLKICVGTNIDKYHSLPRNQACDRWETPEIEVNCSYALPIEMELYFPSKPLPFVVGEAVIAPELVSSPPKEELKIALTFDGMIKGWFYCLLVPEGRTNLESVNSKYLYIHKISVILRGELEKDVTLSVYQNEQMLYEKVFLPIPNSKTLFPNCRNSTRFSDVIRVTLTCDQNYFAPISFLVDRIKRGKTSYFESWLRNQYHSKVGELRIEYFLDNAFLANERKVVSRKPIYPHALSRVSSIITENLQQLHSYLPQTIHTPSLKSSLKSPSSFKSASNSIFDTRPQTVSSITEEQTVKAEEKENQKIEEKEPSTCGQSRGVSRGRSRKLMRSINQGHKINDKAIPCLKKTKTLIKVCRRDPNELKLQSPVQ